SLWRKTGSSFWLAKGACHSRYMAGCSRIAVTELIASTSQRDVLPYLHAIAERNLSRALRTTPYQNLGRKWHVITACPSQRSKVLSKPALDSLGMRTDVDHLHPRLEQIWTRAKNIQFAPLNIQM